MTFINKVFWAMLAGIVLLWVGGGTPVQGAPSSYETAWTNDMNQASYWSNLFGMTCTKYENHNGHIPAQYDAAVIKDGSSVVKVYPDLSSTGAFTATGAINPANGKPYSAPHSWVMKCDAPDQTTTTTTTVPETTTTTVPETTTTTVPVTTVPETTIPETTVPVTTTNETTVPENTTVETSVETIPVTYPEVIPNVCMFGNSYEEDILPYGEFILMDADDPRVVGTHAISGIPCGPLTDISTPPSVTPASTGTLPATGSETYLAWIAAILLVGGMSLMMAARRNRNL